MHALSQSACLYAAQSSEAGYVSTLFHDRSTKFTGVVDVCNDGNKAILIAAFPARHPSWTARLHTNISRCSVQPCRKGIISALKCWQDNVVSIEARMVPFAIRSVLPCNVILDTPLESASLTLCGTLFCRRLLHPEFRAVQSFPEASTLPKPRQMAQLEENPPLRTGAPGSSSAPGVEGDSMRSSQVIARFPSIRGLLLLFYFRTSDWHPSVSLFENSCRRIYLMTCKFLSNRRMHIQ